MNTYAWDLVIERENKLKCIYIRKEWVSLTRCYGLEIHEKKMKMKKQRSREKYIGIERNGLQYLVHKALASFVCVLFINIYA